MEGKRNRSGNGVKLKIGGRIFTPAQVRSIRDYVQVIENQDHTVNLQSPVNNSVADKKDTNNNNPDLILDSRVKKNEKQAELQKNTLQNNQAAIYHKPHPKIKTVVKRTGSHTVFGKSDIPEKIKNGLENNLESQDSLGTQVLSESIEAADKSLKAFNNAQKAAPYVVKATLKVKRITGKTVRGIRRVDAVTARILVGHIKLDKNTMRTAGAYVTDCFSNSRPAMSVKNKIEGIKSAAATTRYYWVKGKNGLQRAVILSKGIALGTVKLSVSRSDLVKLKGYSLLILKKGIKTGVKTVAITAKVSISAVKILDKGALRAGDFLSQSDDNGTQVAGYSLKTAHYVGSGAARTPKIVKGTYKTVKTGLVTGRRIVVKTRNKLERTYTGLKSGIKTIQKYGVGSTAKIYKNKWKKTIPQKVKRKLARVGSAAAKAAVEAAKSVFMKAVLPLLIIMVVILAVVQAVSTAVMSFSSIFSPYLSGENGEIDEVAWMQNRITLKRTGLIKEVKKTYYENLVENGGEYHYIRFFNGLNDAEVELTDTNIFTSIYSVSEYQEYIEPIFHTLMLSEYGLEASDSQMEEALDMIWESLSRIKTEPLPVEYCYAGMVEPDGNNHADLLNCPNASGMQYHADDNEPLCSCDYHYFECDGHKGKQDCGKEAHTHVYTCYDSFHYCYTCGAEGNCNKKGHDVRLERVLECEKKEHTHEEWKSAADSGCYETDYHQGRLTNDCGNSTRHKGCRGFSVCNGHKIMALSVELESFSDLLNRYYLDEIKNLESNATLNADEQIRLRNLRDNYEICITYMDILEKEYGLGSGTIVDLEGITLTEITDFACQFIGNPYIWGGNNPHTGADCSGFVKYVYGNFGVQLPRVAHEQVLCGTTVFSISEAKEGDLIFWSDTGTDSGVYHVAIYLGNGKIIHASNSKPYPQGGIKVSNLYGTIYKIKRIAD